MDRAKLTLPDILVLVGPTASGKTEVSLHLARLLGGEIVSADSRQVYRHLDVGTAKPAAAQRKLFPHHFVDVIPPDHEFNAGEFGVQGRKVIREILDRRRLPIVVGGSGLYIQSLIDGFFEGPGADKEYREILERRIASGQMHQLIDELRAVDPVSALSAEPTKPRRIIRALEVYHATGKPISQHRVESRIAIDFIPRMYGLAWDRQVLYDRINRRCLEMLLRGLLNEVEALERRGYSASANALNTVGYVEAFAYRRGEISYEEMVRLFQMNSRRYAKRQRTWFRRDSRIRWISMNPERDAADVAEEIARLFST